MLINTHTSTTRRHLSMLICIYLNINESCIYLNINVWNDPHCLGIFKDFISQLSIIFTERTLLNLHPTPVRIRNDPICLRPVKWNVTKFKVVLRINITFYQHAMGDGWQIVNVITPQKLTASCCNFMEMFSTTKSWTNATLTFVQSFWISDLPQDRVVYHLLIYQCSRYFEQMICIVSIIKCITICIVLLI